MPFYPELSFQNPNLYNRPINNVPNGYNRPTNSLQQNAFWQQQSFPNANRNFQLRFQTHQPYQPNFPPPRPMAPKPQRPQPMEIDQSMRTANVNYQNRPRQNQFQGKRPASLNVVPPPYKQQRNFHIGSRQQNLDSEMEYQEEPTANFDGNEYFQLLQNEDIEKYGESYDQMDQQYETPTCKNRYRDNATHTKSSSSSSINGDNNSSSSSSNSGGTNSSSSSSNSGETNSSLSSSKLQHQVQSPGTAERTNREEYEKSGP
ncbi:unnamed protein product [Ceratitis capitata]|uniref:(Mediterranean fruit fly) hypothetical protein n=1 Tax=Ceratitis capitata TaxID=7213 RepID=A0A811UA55_CERCA|nr:unnamed protein product [Ceratitis capitata]